MIMVEFRRPADLESVLTYETVARLTLDDDRLETWDPEHMLEGEFGILGIPMPWRGEDGKVRRLYFHDAPRTWLRNTSRILRTGQLVAIVARDDEPTDTAHNEAPHSPSLEPGT